MKDLNKVKRPDLVFQQMDATKLEYNNEKFSVVIDKGTFDALMTDSKEETVALLTKYFEVPNLTDLPLDARTLLKTPVNLCDIDVLDNGSYCHYETYEIGMIKLQIRENHSDVDQMYEQTLDAGTRHVWDNWVLSG
uniref:Uncharacterized protein n=1 Tax=Trichogramma kaykai TaxID=54128 RepID=A0ABD2WI27_9HYME